MQSHYVSEENEAEFVHRETTYWSEVARRAILELRLVKWDLWKVETGIGINNEANFYIMTEFRKPSDVDRLEEIWNFKRVFPNVDFSEIDTSSLSTIVDRVFLYSQVKLIKSQPNYLKVNLARASDLGRYLELENTVWQSFVQERMDADQTNVVSWDLLRVMSPSGVDRPYNALTIDGFNTLSDALQPNYGDSPEYPDLDQFQAVHQKGTVHIFSLVKSVSGL